MMMSQTLIVRLSRKHSKRKNNLSYNLSFMHIEMIANQDYLYTELRFAMDSMGSIRPQNVKRTAEDMVDENPNQFTRDFHENRELLKTKADFSSKKTLNSVAGYVTRYIIKLETRKKRELEEFGATEIP